MNVLDSVMVTGGAGFIGSHLVENLVANDHKTIVYDNFSTGKMINLRSVKNSKNLFIINEDLNNPFKLKKLLKNVKTVFHIAAYPDVKTGFADPSRVFEKNILSTFNLLENLRKSNVERILFASSSVVYGEPSQIPTPETYGPLLPISQYGSSKLACEALISSYCDNYGMSGVIVRFANVVGSRSNHGVIFDFIKKLKKNKKELRYLGSGKQTKSYLHIKDCIEGILFCLENNSKKVDVFNLGNNDRIDVLAIAKIVCKNMNLNNVKMIQAGGTKDGRGWVGDVRQMHLDISKISKFGWNPKQSSKSAVDLASREILRVEPKYF